MNKQIISMTAVAAMAGAALAVESKNVVGFIDKEAEADVYTPVTVMFAGVGVNTLPISSIIFDGIDLFDSLQIFGNTGDVETELFYGRNGWEDQDGEDASNWVFQPGDSFWIAPANGAAVTAKFNGEVKDTALTVTATADVYTPFGNGTPSPVAIADITFDGIDLFDSLQIFGNTGDVETELFYGRNGWEDQDGEDANNWVFQPGDSFWIAPANGADLDVSIPAAI